MSKPEDINISYELEGWGIDYEKQAYDLGDIASDHVDWCASVTWKPIKNELGMDGRKHFQKEFRTLAEAKKWILEETGLGWTDL